MKIFFPTGASKVMDVDENVICQGAKADKKQPTEQASK